MRGSETYEEEEEEEEEEPSGTENHRGTYAQRWWRKTGVTGRMDRRLEVDGGTVHSMLC